MEGYPIQRHQQTFGQYEEEMSSRHRLQGFPDGILCIVQHFYGYFSWLDRVLRFIFVIGYFRVFAKINKLSIFPKRNCFLCKYWSGPISYRMISPHSKFQVDIFILKKVVTKKH